MLGQYYGHLASWLAAAAAARPGAVAAAAAYNKSFRRSGVRVTVLLRKARVIYAQATA